MTTKPDARDAGTYEPPVSRSIFIDATAHQV
jgi:hypothetical protein